MMSRLKVYWRRLPSPVRHRISRALNWTGIPLAVSYFVSYRERHARRHFAGRLPALRTAYRRRNGDERARLAREFDAILTGLVLPNGVSKTTCADRQSALLDRILADPQCRLRREPLRVLDVPASSGIAALGSLRVLRGYHAVRRYVLGDLSFHVLHDPSTGCVYDRSGALLQVPSGRGFFSLYRVHAGGRDCTPVTRACFLPLALRARRLRRRYPFPGADGLDRVSLLHPEVEPEVDDGVMTVEEMDVFEGVPGTHDLILCFNLLQRNYFSPDAIMRGMAALGGALADGGLLVLGRPDVDGEGAHRVLRKEGRSLVTVREEGTL